LLCESATLRYSRRKISTDDELSGLAAALQPLAPAGAGPGVPAEARDATLVCLSYFGAASRPAHVRYLIRRLRRLMPRTQFIACFWMLGDEPAQLEK